MSGNVIDVICCVHSQVIRFGSGRRVRDGRRRSMCSKQNWQTAARKMKRYKNRSNY